MKASDSAHANLDSPNSPEQVPFEHSEGSAKGTDKGKGTDSKDSLPFDLNALQEAKATKDREPLTGEAKAYASELVKELEYNRTVLKDCKADPDTKADFKLDVYYGSIKQIELLDDDLIAKIVILYSNLELFKGQKIKPEDVKVHKNEIEKLIKVLS